MTMARVIDILIDYIDNDLNSSDPEYVRDTLERICSMEEIRELGIYEWLGFNEEE